MGQASGPSLSLWHHYPPPNIPTLSQRPHSKAWRLQDPAIHCECLAKWGLDEKVTGASKGPATEGWGPRGLGGRVRGGGGAGAWRQSRGHGVGS